MEARIFRSLNNMLQMSLGPEYQLRLFSNFPLSQLVRKWPKYVNGIDDVIGLTEEDYISSPRIIWPSNQYPMFEWDNADGKETARFLIGGPFTKGRSVAGKLRNKGTKDWMNKERANDPAAQAFLEAINTSQNEEQLNAKLNANYPRITTNNANIRKKILWAQSIDFVIARDYAVHEPLTHTDLDTAKVVSPAIAVEFDPTTNGCTIHGELRFSEEFVETMHRLSDGSVDHVQAAHRQMKMQDKFSILKDLEMPSCVLPHHAVEVLHLPQLNGLQTSFIKADIVFVHLNSIHCLLNDNLPLDLSNQNQVADYLATRSYCGKQYSFLKSICMNNSVVLEYVHADISSILSEEYTPQMMGYHEFLAPVNVDTIKLLDELGMDINNYPSLKISAVHMGKDYEYTFPIPLGFGSSILHQFDYCMVAGLAAHMLILMINGQGN